MDPEIRESGRGLATARLARAGRHRRAAMLLPQTAEYALRAMAYLASQPPETAVRARDLSEATGVPQHYLAKILRKLVLRELLTSQKGHGGGFRLARPASEIRLAEVLAAVDFTPRRHRCAFGWGECDAEHPCPLHPMWERLDAAYAQWAEQTTLADAGAWKPYAESRPHGRRRARRG
ncbi:MAG: Rrf2 family transcriptional regulator [Planctomycetota bacterium]|nr:MAG: Rrf2 family transcriptional regulator [Planctomycetota bacterium]